MKTTMKLLLTAILFMLITLNLSIAQSKDEQKDMMGKKNNEAGKVMDQDKMMKTKKR